METPADKVTMLVGQPTCLPTRGNAGVIGLQGCTMEAVADSLRGATGRSVIDRTGLSGRYTLELHWTPDNTPVDSPIGGGPSVFTAVQEQLGLKLAPSTALLDVLVIDSAEPPTPN